MTGGVRRALERGDVTIVGVGQGRQTGRESFGKQMEVARLVHTLGRPHVVIRTVDSDGERGVAIVPALQGNETAASLGRLNHQRSVLQRNVELASENAEPLTIFEEEPEVSARKPSGFSTSLPSEGLYVKFIPVRRHQRGGRIVRGYATRRRVRRGQ